MKYFSLLILSMLFMTVYGQSFSACYKDLSYAGDITVAHRLDIYIHKTVKAKYPAVVLLYGSAWLSNSSKDADMNTLGRACMLSLTLK